MKLKIWMILLAFSFAGCSDFLEESSQDEVRPSTVDDMEQLLLGEVYLDEYSQYNNRFVRGTDIFTDDQQCYGLSTNGNRNYFEKDRYTYTWQKDMFDEGGGGNVVDYWKVPYEAIKGCNVVIDYLDRVDGDNAKRENLRGEAYTMRAYYYFLLVNYFGLPYNYGDPEKNPGVPLKLDMNVTEDKYPRNSVAEVYRSIEKDLLMAIRLFDENKMEWRYLRAGELMAKALLSRVYLFMEDWDNALKYTEEVLKEKSQLINLASVRNGNNGDNVYSQSSPELIWARPCYAGGSSGWTLMPYCLSEDFINLFDPGDYNFEDYYRWGDKVYGTDYRGDLRWTCFKWSTVDDFSRDYMERVEYGYNGIRVAEMYLNRAEVYIHKYIESGTDEFRVKALADLNHLRVNRWDTRNGTYMPIDYADGESLLNFYKDERRRELCGESNHRWFDLRRYGMPEIRHVFFEKVGEEQEYVLEKNSPRYVLPIPKAVMEANIKLEQNP